MQHLPNIKSEFHFVLFGYLCNENRSKHLPMYFRCGPHVCKFIELHVHVTTSKDEILLGKRIVYVCQRFSKSRTCEHHRTG